mmetsp:Transcript_140132/g.448092  ORF Transcript_140132/g.448092 Transcript_140132/m.448092 type:complete len:209 (+) Transcript_140132:19-645(+)
MLPAHGKRQGTNPSLVVFVLPVLLLPDAALAHPLLPGRAQALVALELLAVRRRLVPRPLVLEQPLRQRHVVDDAPLLRHLEQGLARPGPGLVLSNLSNNSNLLGDHASGRPHVHVTTLVLCASTAILEGLGDLFQFLYELIPALLPQVLAPLLFLHRFDLISLLFLDQLLQSVLLADGSFLRHGRKAPRQGSRQGDQTVEPILEPAGS